MEFAMTKPVAATKTNNGIANPHIPPIFAQAAAAIAIPETAPRAVPNRNIVCVPNRVTKRELMKFVTMIPATPLPNSSPYKLAGTWWYSMYANGEAGDIAE